MRQGRTPPRASSVASNDERKLRRDAELALALGAPRGGTAHLTRSALGHEVEVYRIELETQNRSLARTQSELEEALAHSRLLFDAAPVGYVTTDAAGRIVAANRTGARLLGRPRGALAGATLQSLLTRDTHETYERNRLATARSRSSQVCDVTVRKPDGREVAVHLETVRAPGPGGRDVHHTVMVDVTRLKRMEGLAQQRQNELAQLLRLHSVAEMAAALTHELSQPLQNIQNFSRGCLSDKPRARAPESVKGALEAILSQADWAGQLVERLRRYVAPSGERAPADLDQVVSAAVAFAAPEARYRSMQLHVELAAGLPPVRIDEVQIKQIVVNLLRNAFDAMESRRGAVREVTIVTRRAGRYVEVRISDRGKRASRVDPETWFRSFYTTKRGGLGLGLTISRTIAEAHGGRLEVEARPGGGVTFRLLLPPADPVPRR